MKHHIKEEKMERSSTERRLHPRIAANIDARFFYGNLFYSGTVMNVSEKGMFIHTRRCLPGDAMFVVMFRFDNELMKVIARVKRSSKNSTYCDGMGIELLSPSSEYLEFVQRLH